MQLRHRRNVAVGIAVVWTLFPTVPTPVARAESAPDRGRAFQPTPIGPELYGIKEPSENAEKQRHFVDGVDGARIYVETWLPEKKGSNVPPDRIPTVVDVTPYMKQGVLAANARAAMEVLVPRGYAFAVSHVRGTGESGGCLEQTGPRQIEDTARVIQYLGRDAPWSNGRVGMYGKSYDAETQISVAGLGDPKKTEYLKAIIPVASVGGQYEWSFMDGVPYLGFGTLGAASYLTVTAEPGETTGPEQFIQKAECQDDMFVNQSDQSGDMTPFWQERELRPGAPHVRAATLIVHGIHDWNVLPLTEAGFFERLPASTPHKAIIGMWGHDYPHVHTQSGIHTEWSRDDWFPMVLDWYDRYLKGIDTGVERWPTVQVQDPLGQWRAEPDWPFTGGPVGHLALGADGALGVARPQGTSLYTEGESGESAPGTEVVFETAALKDRLEITGQPVLDLWVSLDRPDAHIAAKIEALDTNGDPLEWNFDYGFRSARHLRPLVENRFAQAQGETPPTDTPIRVPVRFYPTDVVVPKGGKLRMTISGAMLTPAKESSPSGLGTRVTVLHDCDHPSALRFVMARENPQLLNVREIDEDEKPLPSSPSPTRSTNGGGLATGKVCGKSPIALPIFSRPELKAPRVTLRVSDATPSYGETITFRAGLKACAGHRRTMIQLRRKLTRDFRLIAKKRMNRRCVARFRTPATFREATFRAYWVRQDEDHRRGRSRAITVVTH